jgi:hypothetical protein
MLQIPARSIFSLRVVDAQNLRDLEQILSVYRAWADFLALDPQPHASIEMIRTDLEIARQAGSTFYAITAPLAKWPATWISCPRAARTTPDRPIWH